MNDHHALRQLKKDTFISILAIISVAIGVYDFNRPRADAHFTPLDVLDLAIVGIFIVEFVHSARASRNWRAYLKQHWYELPSLIPVTGNMVAGADAVPLLRGLRLVRLVRIARLLRLIGAAARLRNFLRPAIRIAERAHIAGLTVFAAITILIGAGLAWIFEASVNEKFHGAEPIWWALNMFSNVAYVDFQPMTAGGRIVAVILEFSGIGFIGLFTASLANALLRDEGAKDDGDVSPLD